MPAIKDNINAAISLVLRFYEIYADSCQDPGLYRGGQYEPFLPPSPPPSPTPFPPAVCTQPTGADG